MFIYIAVDSLVKMPGKTVRLTAGIGTGRYAPDTPELKYPDIHQLNNIDQKRYFSRDFISDHITFKIQQSCDQHFLKNEQYMHMSLTEKERN